LYFLLNAKKFFASNSAEEYRFSQTGCKDPLPDRISLGEFYFYSFEFNNQNEEEDSKLLPF
jgi:hypothetical protein